MINNYYMYKSPTNCQKDIKIFNLHEDIILPKNFKNSSSFIEYRKVNFEYTKELLKEKISIPNNWSWRYNGLNKIELGGIRNQGKCDISWAFALISALGDRYAIKYNIAAPYLSILYFLIKSKPKNFQENLCDLKGNTYLGLLWLENNYTTLELCWPWKIIKEKDYKFPSNLEDLKDCCFNCCNDQDIDIINNTHFSCQKNSTNLIVNTTDKSNIEFVTIDIKNTINAIKIEIIKNGPVLSTFNLFDDFLYYWQNDAKDKKIYVRKSVNKIGQHSVVITGWGVRENIRFWEVRNSWGNNGNEGYFYIAFSQDTPKDKWCHIDIPSYKNNTFECGVISFLPGELNNIELFKKPQVKSTITPHKYTELPSDNNENENEKAFSISEEKSKDNIQIYTHTPEKKITENGVKGVKGVKEYKGESADKGEISLDIKIAKKKKIKSDNFIIQKIILYFCIVIIVVLVIIIIIKIINKKYSNDIYRYFSYSTNNQNYSENFHHPIVLPY